MNACISVLDMEKTETRTEADPAQRLERLAINTDGVILNHNYGDNPYLTVEPTKGDAVEIRLANHQWIVQTGTIKGPENYELGVNKASYENYLKARRAFEFRVEDLKAIRLMTNKKRSDDRNLNWMYGPQLPDSGTATLRTTWWHIHPQNGYAIDAHENPEWHVKIRNSSRCRPE